MYTYFLKKYDCLKLGKFLSKKCKVSFFAKYIYKRMLEKNKHWFITKTTPSPMQAEFTFFDFEWSVILTDKSNWE